MVIQLLIHQPLYIHTLQSWTSILAIFHQPRYCNFQLVHYTKPSSKDVEFYEQLSTQTILYNRIPRLDKVIDHAQFLNKVCGHIVGTCNPTYNFGQWMRSGIASYNQRLLITNIVISRFTFIIQIAKAIYYLGCHHDDPLTFKIMAQTLPIVFNIKPRMVSIF